MKNTLIAIIILISPTVLQAQYFSGEIIYETKIIPKSDTADVASIIKNKHGNIAKYIIMPKRYKSTYYKDEIYRYSYTYDDETKRMYDDYTDKPYITYRDSRKSNTKYFDSKVFRDSISKVLVYDTYMVTSKADYGTTTTFYSDDIRVNYLDFEGHKVGNWYNKLKEVNGAIMLKSITEFENYFEVQQAVKIENREIEVKEFNLPDKPVAAAFSALDSRVTLIEPSQEQIICYQQKVRAVSKENGEKFTSYISFFLSKEGVIMYVDAHEDDEFGFYEVGIDVIKDCGFQFVPGQIQGEAVDSQVYFPIEFRK